MEENKKRYTFRGYWNQVYYPWAKKNLKPDSLAVKVPVMEKYVLPFFGRMPLDAIDEGTIMKWHEHLDALINDKTGKKLSESYIRTINNQFVAVLSRAEEEKLVIKNMGTSLGSVGSHAPAGIRYWTTDMYEAYSRTLKEGMTKTASDLAFWCGLKRNEILRLQTEDISDDGSCIEVRNLRPVRPGWTGSPVVVSSPFEEREVDVPIFIRSELLRAKKQAEASGIDRVFSISKSTLTRLVSDAVRESGLPALGLEGFRDSHIIILICSGTEPSAIAHHAGISLQALERRLGSFFHEGQQMSQKAVDAIRDDVIESKKRGKNRTEAVVLEAMIDKKKRGKSTIPERKTTPSRRKRQGSVRKQIAGYLYAKDVSEIMGIAVPTAYKVIRDLNAKLAAEGYITVSGRIPENYFRKHCPV